MVDALRDFVESRVPFLEHVFRTWHTSLDQHQRTSSKYCFKQAFFYAAVNYMDWHPYISEEATLEAGRRKLGDRLSTARWDHQPSFDPGRKVFQFEHVYTGEMCWSAIEPMRGKIMAESVVALVRENYAIAWILKSEDRRLPKSLRGTTLKDAMAIYEKNNIRLVREVRQRT